MKRIFKDVQSFEKSLAPEKTFTLLSGCFDLLHVNHMRLFERAACFEELLVIAILSDEKIQKYKGGARPIITENQRAKMLSCVRFIDKVFIANTDPIGKETIKLLEPDSIVFTDEEAVSDKVQKWSENIKSWSPSTTIRIAPYNDDEDISTTSIINKIRSYSG